MHKIVRLILAVMAIIVAINKSIAFLGVNKLSRNKARNQKPSVKFNTAFKEYESNFYAQYQLAIDEYYMNNINAYIENQYGKSKQTAIHFLPPTQLDKMNAIGFSNLMVIDFCNNKRNMNKFVKFQVFDGKLRKTITGILSDKLLGQGLQTNQLPTHSVVTKCSQASKIICKNTCQSKMCFHSEFIGMACVQCNKKLSNKSKSINKCVAEFMKIYVYKVSPHIVLQQRLQKKAMKGSIFNMNPYMMQNNMTDNMSYY